MMRYLLAGAVLALLFVPSAAACTAPPGPVSNITLEIEEGDNLLHEIDTGMSHQSNQCGGPFRLPLTFDGRFVTWRVPGADDVTVADALDGSLRQIAFAGRWSAGQGLLLDLPDTLRVRELTSTDTFLLPPPHGSQWSMTYGPLALAANGTDASGSFGIYDAKQAKWLLEDIDPTQPGWPQGGPEWLGFSPDWVLFVAERSIYAYRVSDEQVIGPLPEPDTGTSPWPRQNGSTQLLDLRGDVAYFVEPTYSLGSPYSDQAWSVNLSALTISGNSRPPAETVDGLTARFRLDPVSTTSPTPGPTGSTPDTSSNEGSDQGQGQPSDPSGATPMPIPAPTLVLVGLAAALAVALAWRRRS